MAERRVVVIGNFDGVHRGHVSLINKARRDAGDGQLIAVTFWPHTMSVIRPDRPPQLLTDLTERQALLRAVGVDEVHVVEFTSEVAAWSPEYFVDEVLRPLRPDKVMAGENFRFGAKAAGDVDLLAKLGRAGTGSDRFAAAGIFAVEGVGLAATDGDIYSSTKVRQALDAGDVVTAQELLNRPFRVRGVVIEGAHRGREMGFPTANVPVSEGFAVPCDGVYAGWTTRLDRMDAKPWPAAISVGNNPTFPGEAHQVEPYVLDRDDLELYGVEIGIDFAERLRGQIAYPGMAALIDQMRHDVDQARQILTR